MEDVRYGIIGGSGLLALAGFSAAEKISLKTPFGDPSDSYTIGNIGETRVAFLPRHGRGHRLLPSEINSRANIYGFKLLGAKAILSSSAVGSLREDVPPGTMVVLDQFIDRTKGRPSSFFGGGIAAHVGFSDPFCPELRRRLVGACQDADAPHREGGTYLCMEGPAFSTRAESLLYRSWGADVIGMTNIPEAKLAREAEICYATLGTVTDYDCWHPRHASVQIGDVLRILGESSRVAGGIFAKVASGAPPESCGCQRALDGAVLTARDLWPEEAFHRLRPLLERAMEGACAGAR